MDIQQAGGSFTQSTIAKYNEQIKAPSFLTALFKPVKKGTKFVTVTVKRGSETLAVEVLRGTAGNPNDVSRVSLKHYLPRFFDEKFDITELEGYDVASVEDASISAVVALSEKTAETLLALKAKIDRSKENMAAQVLEFGVVETKYGESIDYQRKPASLVDLSANPWTTVTTDVEQQLQDGGDFLRSEGKSMDGLIDVIMSAQAWIALQKTDYFKEKASFNNVKQINIVEPKLSTTGSVYHGTIDFGNYTGNIWCYDQTYENTAGTDVKYLNPKKIIMIPNSGTEFVYAHGGISVMQDGRIRIIKAEIAQYSNVDAIQTTHDFGLKSAPLPVPVTIDMIYTAQILA